MKPAPFRYARAESIDQALQLLASGGDGTKVLAGGQSLIALLNLRLARPEVLLDIADLSQLRRYGRVNGALEIGALVTQGVLERDAVVRERCPLLAEAIPHIGHAAIRNRGTMGGTIAHADPAAEVPVVLAALDGSVRLHSSSGERSVSARDFFKGFLMTAARPDELITSVVFPATGAETGIAFEEFARRSGDFALVSVACAIDRFGDGRVRSARLALGGVSATPLVIDGLDAIDGATGTDAVRVAAEIVGRAIGPRADIHGSEGYRRHLAGQLVKRAVRRAIGRGS